MGIFDKVFGKEKAASAEPSCEPLTVYAPADGEVIAISEFPDELFSQEALGPGCGIRPEGDAVYAPFNGTVTQVIDTFHAVGVTSRDGMEVLIHVGVDTVKMNGEGFSSCVKKGQTIRKGDPLLRFDREAIKAAGYSDAIAVVVTNIDDFSDAELKLTGPAVAGEPILKIHK